MGSHIWLRLLAHPVMTRMMVDMTDTMEMMVMMLVSGPEGG